MAQIMGCKQKNYYFLFNQRLFHNKNIMHLQMLDINQMQKIPITVSQIKFILQKVWILVRELILV